MIDDDVDDDDNNDYKDSDSRWRQQKSDQFCLGILMHNTKLLLHLLPFELHPLVGLHHLQKLPPLLSWLNQMSLKITVSLDVTMWNLGGTYQLLCGICNLDQHQRLKMKVPGSFKTVVPVPINQGTQQHNANDCDPGANLDLGRLGSCLGR